MESSQQTIASILDFWFEGVSDDADRLKQLMQRWFAGSADHDRELADRFGELAAAAARGEFDHWVDTPQGRLALIILLDQLPRNLHRGTAEAFAQDRKALDCCLDGIRQGQDQFLEPLERMFFYMPLQHAESKETQAFSVATFEKLADSDAPGPLADLLEGTVNYAIEHREIVDRFGRFPHRNNVLGRESSDEEIEFLASGGSNFGQ